MTSERARMRAGELYDALDPDLVAGRARARELCRRINADLRTLEPTGDDPRRALARELFGAGGESVWLQPPFYCDYGTSIELGERVYFNFNCVVLDVCRVRIGSFTLFGPGVQVLTPLHPMDPIARRSKEYGAPITIGSDVWVGAGALILPGVTIGDGAVIGAGAIVTRDVPARMFAAGNPARVIRSVDESR